ncbi:MAG TPA: hypothetical protein GXX29_09635 [Firmicutes bacterium]|nr:hypothetical protein [Bacillota bacterium]
MGQLEELRMSWDEIYKTLLPEGFAAIGRARGVVVGIHSVIDGLVRFNADKVAKALAEDKALLAAVLDEQAAVPLEINSPKDFMIGLFSSFRRGKALQLMIRDEETFRWVMNKLGYDFLRMGGTSGNMANSLSPLGFPVVVYAHPLTKELAELFVERPNLKVLADDGELRAPKEAAKGEGIKALHLIVEYSTGDSITIGGQTITAPRANRYIAAWNPVNNKLQINPAWKKNMLEKAGLFSHFVISGFHILSEKYPDGTTYADYLIPVGEFIAQLREKHPHLKLHYEFASIASPLIRGGIIEHILPRVHSLGLNEVELGAILRNVGAMAEAEAVEKEEGVAAVMNGLAALMKHTGLARIQLHDLGYYLTLTKPGYAAPEITRTGLVLAATLAASRTATGQVGERAQIEEGLQFPFIDKGLQRGVEIGAFLGDAGFASQGIGRWGEYEVIFLPTKVVPKPVLTVGLGDLISASSFVAGSPVSAD